MPPATVHIMEHHKILLTQHCTGLKINYIDDIDFRIYARCVEAHHNQRYVTSKVIKDDNALLRPRRNPPRARSCAGIVSSDREPNPANHSENPLAIAIVGNTMTQHAKRNFHRPKYF